LNVRGIAPPGQNANSTLAKCSKSNFPWRRISSIESRSAQTGTAS
jgi:hypothetical protein